MHHQETIDNPNFFEAGSPYLDHPLLTTDRTNRELDFILSELDLKPGARVLDVGCGFGRHSIALAQRGYLVTAIDPAAAMISAAREHANRVKVVVEFVEVRMEEWSTDRKFDAAICLYTTLGQVSESGDNRDLIPGVYGVLKSGGFFIVEVAQRHKAVEMLKAFEKIGDREPFTTITRRYHPGDQTITEVFTRAEKDQARTYLLSYRLFDQKELLGLLTQAGFDTGATYGGYDGSPLSVDSATMLFFSQKPVEPSSKVRVSG